MSGVNHGRSDENQPPAAPESLFSDGVCRSSNPSPQLIIWKWFQNVKHTSSVFMKRVKGLSPQMSN